MLTFIVNIINTFENIINFVEKVKLWWKTFLIETSLKKIRTVQKKRFNLFDKVLFLVKNT